VFCAWEEACGEPDDVGVDRDLDDGLAGAVVLPAGADAEQDGQGLLPGAGGELAHPPLLAGDPGSAAQSVVDGAGGWRLPGNSCRRASRRTARRRREARSGRGEGRRDRRRAGAPADLETVIKRALAVAVAGAALHVVLPKLIAVRGPGRGCPR
jgi:hypothetical protein